MRNGKYASNVRRRRRRSSAGKGLVMVLVCVMLMCGVFAGTLAWLTSTTGNVENTFTTSDITITLQEHEYDAAEDELKNDVTTTGNSNYKMIPGWTIPKDPWVTVEKGSEKCYVFIQVIEEGGVVEGKDYTFDSFIDYDIKSEWKTEGLPVDAVGVYYQVVDASEEAKTLSILAAGSGIGANGDYSWLADQVITKPTVTKEMMEAVEAANARPKLSFKAYAIQYNNTNDGNFDVATAWANVPKN